MGGIKVPNKIQVLSKLMEKSHAFIIGGTMANTFLAAQGHDTGNSQIEAADTKAIEEFGRILKEPKSSSGTGLWACSSSILSTKAPRQSLNTWLKAAALPLWMVVTLCPQPRSSRRPTSSPSPPRVAAPSSNSRKAKCSPTSDS